MHSKKFTKTERRGLPGGPNEVFTYVTGVFSTEGYKNDSPDKDNPFNIIPSGNITMKDVDFPVMGIDNLGNSKMMMPGGEYEFPGDMVFEMPMGKSGIEIKPENRGKFTRWAKKRGMTVKQAYAKVLANKDKYPPSIVKMANFARNAAGWKKEDGGENQEPKIAPIQLDEVVVKGYNLNEDEKKLYDIFRTGGVEFVDNPNYDPKGKGTERRKMIPLIKDGKKVREFVPTLDMFKNTNGDIQKYEVSFDDALRLYREAGSPTISNEPSVLAKIFPKKFNVTEESNSFRPHASINKIYIPPGTGMAGFKNFLAEIAHLHPDYRFLPTIEGTFDRIKRSYKESDFLIPIGLIPFPSTIADKSNYKSKKDFEYKTHQIAEKNILDDYFDKKEFKKAGGTVSWNFKGKTYSGTLIPSMEDANNRYARTHNGKIKTLPKKKMGGKLRIYKDFVNGVYDNSSNIDFVQSVFDKVNRIYHNQAKEANMSTPNYVMSFLVDG